MGLESEQKPPRASVDALVSSLKDGLQMRLLTLCLSHSWGGVEQVVANDALDLGGLGLNVRVLCLEGSPLHENLLHRTGTLGNVRAVPIQFEPRRFLDFKIKHEFERLFTDGVNIIHTHQPGTLGSVAPWLWGRPGVALLASRYVLSHYDRKTIFHEALFRRLDALLVPSVTLRQNTLSTHAIKDRLVKIVNLGLDFDRFNPERVDPSALRAEWGADAETIVIGAVGKLEPSKGQDLLIKAAAGLLKTLRFGKKVKIVIVGEETLGRSAAYLEELRRIVAQFRLDDYVVFADYQENVHEVMRAFDIFVMPSLQETFGLLAVEAMAMERPIVIPRGGSGAEIVGNGEFGLLMRPLDAFDLQRQLHWMITHPESRVEMGRRARERVKKYYDRKVRLHRTLEIYEKAMRRRSFF